MTLITRQVRLASRPQGNVVEDNFRMVEVPLADPAEGEVVIRNEWLSLDPYMRGRMSDAKSYVPPVPLDGIMVGQTVGEVIASRAERVKVGDKVLTQVGWQTHGIAAASDVTKIDVERAPASYYLGILGMPGMTAWFDLFEIGAPKPGETVVVSAASGAVGSVVGQLAKIQGCRAVGIAGGKAKCDYVVGELGFDACVDHQADHLYEALCAACPGGVDVNFENVGGSVLDTTLRVVNRGSRVIVCGLVAEYNATQPFGHNLRAVLVNRTRMQGMIVFDWKDRYGEALKGLSGHLAQGRLKYRESIVEGLESAPRALMGLLRGENFGKQLVRMT